MQAFLVLLGLTSCLALASTGYSDGVAVVGCGVLGTSLCKQILECPNFEGRQVIGITKSTTRHDEILQTVGSHDGRFQVKAYGDLGGQTFKDVVFCAPPSGSDDYPAAVKDAASSVWAGRDSGGTFVFTSSGAVFGGNDGEIVTETSPLTDTPRAMRLIQAENAARSEGGAVLRLAGLYLLERGAHNYWLQSGKDVDGRADGVVNLLHYDDAAGACMAALQAFVGDGTFLVSDGSPLTRKEICEVATKARMYSGKSMPKFLGTDADPKGKVYNGSWTNQVLKWEPRYASFDAFMTEHV